MAIEVIRNGQRLCTAGVQEGSATAITMLISLRFPDNADVQIHGYSLTTREQLRWVNDPLRLGDEFIVRIVDADATDAPAARESNESAPAKTSPRVDIFLGRE